MKSTYEVLNAELDTLYDAHDIAIAGHLLRRKAAEDAHARPSLEDIALDKTKEVFRAWSRGGSAVAARNAALAPFVLEFDVLVAEFDAKCAECYARHGWTEPEHTAEIHRRLELAHDEDPS